MILARDIPTIGDGLLDVLTGAGDDKVSPTEGPSFVLSLIERPQRKSKYGPQPERPTIVLGEEGALALLQALKEWQAEVAKAKIRLTDKGQGG